MIPPKPPLPRKHRENLGREGNSELHLIPSNKETAFAQAPQAQKSRNATRHGSQNKSPIEHRHQYPVGLCPGMSILCPRRARRPRHSRRTGSFRHLGRTRGGRRTRHAGRGRRPRNPRHTRHNGQAFAALRADSIRRQTGRTACGAFPLDGNLGRTKTHQHQPNFQ